MDGLVKDNEKIRIIKPITVSVSVIRRGFWYSDQILGYLDNDIAEYSWSRERGWAVTLADTEAVPKEYVARRTKETWIICNADGCLNLRDGHCILDEIHIDAKDGSCLSAGYAAEGEGQ